MIIANVQGPVDPLETIKIKPFHQYPGVNIQKDAENLWHDVRSDNDLHS